MDIPAATQKALPRGRAGLLWAVCVVHVPVAMQEAPSVLKMGRKTGPSRVLIHARLAKTMMLQIPRSHGLTCNRQSR